MKLTVMQAKGVTIPADFGDYASWPVNSALRS
jgi:hypothetical protein